MENEFLIQNADDAPMIIKEIINSDELLRSTQKRKILEKFQIIPFSNVRCPEE